MVGTVRNPNDPNILPEYTGAARALGQGVSLGWGDEAEAWLRSKLTGQDYEQSLQKIQGESAQYHQKHPFISTGLEFAGGALPFVLSGGASAPVTGARTLGTLGRIAENPFVRNAVIGGTTGAIAGAGGAEEGRREEGAVGGGVFGAGLGVAIPAVLRGGSEVYNWAKNRIAPSVEAIGERAAQKFKNALQTNPDELAQKMTEYGNTPAMMLNLDPGLAQLAETVAQRGGKGASELERKITAQKADARERVMGNIKENISPKNYYAEEENIIKDLRTKADPYYKSAYKYGEVKDPEVLKFMELPQFKKALVETENLLAAEGRKLPTEPIYNAEGKKIGEKPAPTVEVFDQVKRGLDALIERETDALTGKKTSLGRVYTDKKNEFLSALDNAVPDFGKARSIYKGDAEVLDALRTGYKDFGKLDQEQVVKLISKMSNAEQEAFRTGVARNLYNKIMDPAMDFNAAKKIIGSPKMQEKLQPLFDSPEKFDLFKNVLERESQLYHEANKVLGGSQTSKRQQMRAEFEEEPMVADIAGKFAVGDFLKGLTSTAMKAFNNTNLNEKTAAKLSEMLTAGTPHEVAAAVQSLEDYAAKAGPREAAKQQLERNITAGATAASPPAPVAEDTSRPRLEDLDEEPTYTRDIEADIAKSKK